eukprot:940243-Pleurochrysis_carterae.AAC.2
MELRRSRNWSWMLRPDVPAATIDQDILLAISEERSRGYCELLIGSRVLSEPPLDISGSLESLAFTSR